MKIQVAFCVLLCLGCKGQEGTPAETEEHKSEETDTTEHEESVVETTQETEAPPDEPSENDESGSEEDPPSTPVAAVNSTDAESNFTENGSETETVSDCNSNTLLAILIPTAVYALIVSILVPILVYRQRAKKRYSARRDIMSFLKSRVSLESESDSLRYDKDQYELSPTEFRINIEKSLGSGSYGLVCLGSITRGAAVFPVAVKVVKKDSLANIYDDGRKRIFKSLLSELQILSSVGKHPNIVRLEGAYTQNLRRGELYVFLEYCSLGNLQMHLQAYGTGNSDDIFSSGKETMDDELAEDICKWCVEIASGMEHLASHNVIHGDLSLRNILLTSAKCAKISDFGLSRHMHDYLCVKSTQEPLPERWWRWMAPESLSRMIFNEKTDVWAFGVTLWEMYTLGNLPYSGLSWEINFVTRLEGGLRLPQPKYNENEIYSVMARCWSFDPEIRPKFSELRTFLIQRWKKNSSNDNYTVFMDDYTDIPL